MKRMRISHRILALLAVVLMASVLMPAEAGARKKKKKDAEKVIEQLEQETLLEDKALNLLTDILQRYVPWKRAEFNGKLRMSQLPISPTVKIFLQKDQLIQISVRAPFLGELGRVEVTPTGLLGVNKYNKTYCQERMDNVESLYPNAIGDVQSLLLGRVVIFGQGELDNSNSASLLMQEADNGEWVLMPLEQPGSGKVEYGYVVGPTGRTQTLMGRLEGKDYGVTLQYAYPDNSMELSFDVQTGKKPVAGTLDFSSVKWGGTPMSTPGLSGYRRVSLEEFVKNATKR